jgi:hypothetical protein
LDKLLGKFRLLSTVSALEKVTGYHEIVIAGAKIREFCHKGRDLNIKILARTANNDDVTLTNRAKV